MKLAIWVSGKLNGQALLEWAKERQHEAVCLISMNPEKHDVVWATKNIDELKKVSDDNKIDLIFKSVKKTGDENFAAIATLVSYAKKKYGAEAIAVEKNPSVAHPIGNAAKHLGLKTILFTK